MPTRRTVLAGAAAATAVAAGAAVGLRREVDRSVLDASLPADERWAALQLHLRDTYGYLQLPDETLDAFGEAARRRGKLPDDEEDLLRLRRQFLMSTDFLANDADEGRVVRFVAWFDPYETPCWNPLGRPPT